MAVIGRKFLVDSRRGRGNFQRVMVFIYTKPSPCHHVISLIRLVLFQLISAVESDTF